MALLISVLEQGLIYAIMAFGIYITYKILDFPDLTVDGSFPMGAAIAAALISRDVNPLLTLPICFLLGAVVGTLTGLIHVKLKVRDLLSGIIMMTALYTVNLRIAGRANLPIYNKSTIFQNDLVDKIIPKSLSSFKVVIIVLIITLISKYILDWYLRTKSGMLLRAVGDNDHIITSLGVNKGKVKVVGLAISNGLVALSGCVFAQQQRYFDVSMGTGTMVIGLASVIIGTSLFRKVTILRVTSSVVIGSVISEMIVTTSMESITPSSTRSSPFSQSTFGIASFKMSNNSFMVLSPLILYCFFYTAVQLSLYFTLLFSLCIDRYFYDPCF